MIIIIRAKDADEERGDEMKTLDLQDSERRNEQIDANAFWPSDVIEIEKVTVYSRMVCSHPSHTLTHWRRIGVFQSDVLLKILEKN
jgi:hypothetical protein